LISGLKGTEHRGGSNPRRHTRGEKHTTHQHAPTPVVGQADFDQMIVGRNGDRVNRKTVCVGPESAEKSAISYLLLGIGRKLRS
jgi:hypothetical protein